MSEKANVTPAIVNTVPETVYHNVKETTDTIQKLSTEVGSLRSLNATLKEKVEKIESEVPKLLVEVRGEDSISFDYGWPRLSAGKIKSVSLTNPDSIKEYLTEVQKINDNKEINSLKSKIEEQKETINEARELENDYKETIFKGELALTELKNEFESTLAKEALRIEDHYKTKLFKKDEEIIKLNGRLELNERKANNAETELLQTITMQEELLEQLKRDLNKLEENCKSTNIFTRLSTSFLYKKYKKFMQNVTFRNRASYMWF